MSLTKNEFAILKAIDESEYGDALSDDIWLFSASDYAGISGKQLSGVISSLVQKGFVRTGDYEGKGCPDDATIQMTPEGIAAYVDATKLAGGIVIKRYAEFFGPGPGTKGIPARLA